MSEGMVYDRGGMGCVEGFGPKQRTIIKRDFSKSRRPAPPGVRKEGTLSFFVLVSGNLCFRDVHISLYEVTCAPNRGETVGHSAFPGLLLVVQAGAGDCCGGRLSDGIVRRGGDALSCGVVEPPQESSPHLGCLHTGFDTSLVDEPCPSWDICYVSATGQ